MPIKPENRKRYPLDWPLISWFIRFVRAEGRCECSGECGLHRGRRCIERHGDPGLFMAGRVILTTMHLDHEPENCRGENLLAGCQRCHNRYDRGHRRQSAAEAAGQERLPLNSPQAAPLPPE